MARQEVEALATRSRSYGADPAFVFLGGGNTSFKTADTLYIKPSGVALADIQADDFIAMDRRAIRQLYASEVPVESGLREGFVKDMMAAAVRPPGCGRPSVEAPLHELIDCRYVIHLHPAKVNGMTCSVEGADACARLFPDALWVDYIDPGATLAIEIKKIFDGVSGPQAQILILQNHGVFVGADTLAEIDAIYGRIMRTLDEAYAAAGMATELATCDCDFGDAMRSLPELRGALGSASSLPVLTVSPDSFKPAAGPLTPDHMVYAKSFPCEVGAGQDAVTGYREAQGMDPKVLIFDSGAVAGVGSTLKGASDVLLVAKNAALVEQLTGAFGGPRYLPDREREFIESWEVESYRQKVAVGSGPEKRAQGKICVVTGGARGFGLGIAEGLVAEGATVFLADLNLAGAEESAQSLNQTVGHRVAVPVKVDISDEDSVKAMVREVVLAAGGIDLFVANAGVLKAGSVKDFELTDWQLVTKVNYTGYFLCAKHIAPVMAAQNEACPGNWSDIVQVNSKSGLRGSNRNAAYAGSKFGTIGLTQSFALELVADRIKVNSVCPGNFFEGPLWSDPEQGLFRQYLDSGKVPGAGTVEEVKRFYEGKVPMGRGCLPHDVVKAILYLVEQDYETGQALPVTGGQVMLN